MSDALTAIRALYFAATKATIERDFDTVIDLLKSMATEDERDRAAVYMEGLAQMKAQWATSRPPKASPMSGRLRCVSSLAKAIATCRGRATLRLRFLEYISATLIL